MRFKVIQHFSLVLLLPILFSCKEGMKTRDNGTRLNSKDYPNKEERLAAFSKVLSGHSPIQDVEFDLFNVNGFGNDRSVAVPGASSSSYRYVVKVDPADVHLWTEFLQPFNPDTSLAWQDSLISARKEQWVCKSTPQYFGSGKGFFVVAYKPEGIIFREMIRN